MTANELRELADTTEALGAESAADFIRACADALDAGPVATALMLRGELVNVFPRPPENASDLRYWIDKGYSEAPLYPLAMPAQAQALRLPEPMAEDELLDTYAHTPGSIACALRAIEAETLRRVMEANK